jgi:hypothetical protein
MTEFERDTLHTLLCMYEKDIKENGIIFNGNKIDGEKTQGFINKINEIECLLTMTD